MLLELPDLVLNILLVSSADELQVCNRAIAGRQDHQAPLIRDGLVPLQVDRGQRQEGLLCPEAFATTTGVTSRAAEAIRLNCKL